MWPHIHTDECLRTHDRTDDPGIDTGGKFRAGDGDAGRRLGVDGAAATGWHGTDDATHPDDDGGADADASGSADCRRSDTGDALAPAGGCDLRRGLSREHYRRA